MLRVAGLGRRVLGLCRLAAPSGEPRALTGLPGEPRAAYAGRMLLGIDHFVIAVPDPDAAALDFADVLGLAATGGGRHEGSGTFNRLIFLGDTYLELIGIWDRGLAAGSPIGAAALAALDADRSGLVTWAIATDGARREVASLRAMGSPIGDVVAGERVRQDGAVVRWHTAAAAPLGAARPPFLIEHELAGPEWGEEARRARAAFVHPFGGRAQVVGLELAVERPEELSASFAHTLGVVFEPAAGDEPGDQEARFGPHVIRLVSSGQTAARERAAGGPNGGAPATRTPAPGVRAAGIPAARVGLKATAGQRLLVDVCGVRFARL